MRHPPQTPSVDPPVVSQPQAVFMVLLPTWTTG